MTIIYSKELHIWSQQQEKQKNKISDQENKNKTKSLLDVIYTMLL